VPALKGLPDAVPERLDGALDPAILSDERLARVARREGRWQLGTLGRGNHFLEFQADEQGSLWLMVHSGSRGMGQAITSWHLARAVAPAPAAPVALEADSAVGLAYLADVAWARAWARTNREWMARAAGGVLADLAGVTFDARLAGRLVDEAPSAYRDIRVVMRTQRDLTAVRRELRPLLSHKAV
jgi:tRNA-splicing ligase RtcB (3'-phosphate/5'-hydroxy nucleic acid ligase)